MEEKEKDFFHRKKGEKKNERKKKRKRKEGKKGRKQGQGLKSHASAQKKSNRQTDKPLFSRRHATLHLAVSVGMSTIRNWIAVYPALFSKKQIN